MATIKDVARTANVTPATVSNVIRNKGIVAAATQQRVLAAIDALGYQPNLLARGLVEGKSSTLALLVPNIANPFYPEIALELENLARQHGHQLILCNTHNETQTGREYLRRFAGGFVDGVVALAGGIELADLEDLARRGIPVIRCLFSEELELRGVQNDLPSVDYDFAGAAEVGARHLLELGHRSFWVVMEGGQGRTPDQVSRLRGYRSALSAAGIDLPESDVLYGEYTLESAVQVMAQRLRAGPPPTAVLASNDLTALAATEAIYQHGLSVPGDISVVGIDNIPMSAHVRPELTTAAFPTRQLARHVIDFLLGPPELENSASRHQTLFPQLVVRRSTAPPSR